MTATCEVLPLPAIRLLTARRLPLADREIHLAWLAQHAEDLPPALVTLGRDAWSHDDLHGPSLEVAWEAYLHARRLAEDADEGRIHWSLIDPELTCTERHEAAVEIAHADADAALHVLARGSHSTNGGTR